MLRSFGIVLILAAIGLMLNTGNLLPLSGAERQERNRLKSMPQELLGPKEIERLQAYNRNEAIWYISIFLAVLGMLFALISIL